MSRARPAPATGEVEALGQPRTRQLIVTLFGLYGRDTDGALPVAALIRLLGALGVASAPVRSSVSRLKKNGVLQSLPGVGAPTYQLAPELASVFEEGDARIFGPRPERTAGRWLLVAFTVPESQRNLRHLIRSALAGVGCGQVTPGLWIARADAEPSLRRQLERIGAMDNVELFLASRQPPLPTAQKVAKWWDLSSLDAGYAAFVEAFAPVLDRWDANPGGDLEAFAEYVPLLTRWRRFSYRDPGLPVELLPGDWHGLTAERLFDALHARLSAPARRAATSLIAG